jgi:hypothetical protein
LVNLISVFLSTLRNPSLAKKDGFLKKLIFFDYIFLLFILVISKIILHLLLIVVYDAYYFEDDLDIIKLSFGTFNFEIFFVAVLYGPIYEELAFRLNLIISKRNLFISCTLIFFLVLGYFIENISYRLFFSFLISMIPWFYASKIIRILNLVPFFFIFYGYSFLFGYLHALNFINDGSINENINPIWFLPHISAGIIFAFARLRYGIFASVLLHSSSNLIFLIPKWLS